MSISRVVLALILAIVCAITSVSSQSVRLDSDVERSLAAITPEFLKAHISFLGDDLLEGRRPGTAGYDIAAKHVAAALEGLGLQPGAGGSFFQKVPLLETTPDPTRTTMVLERPGESADALVFGRDFVTAGQPFETTVDVSAPMVFVGYGIEAPEQKHDDYRAADVAGKIAVVLFGAPSRFPATARAHYASQLTKAAAAVRHGAVGIVWLATPELEKLYPWKFLAADEQRGALRWVDANRAPANAFRELRVSLWVSLAATERLLGGTLRAEDVFAKVAKGDPIAPTPLQSRLRARLVSAHRHFESSNVVAAYEGQRADEYVVYTAHLDHLGVAEAVDGDAIYNGVLDNASGVAGMLAAAKAFSLLEQRPLRSVLFVAVTAEENGLIGSDYFARNPTVPAAALKANVNMDGLPVLYDFRDVISFGSEHSTVVSAVQRATRRLGLELTPDPFPEQMFFVRSDQYSFVKQGVPAVFTGEGLKTVDASVDARKIFNEWQARRYHQPSDDLNQPLNFAAAAKGARLQFLIGYFLATDRDAPQWNPGDFFGTRFGRKQ